MSDDNLPSMIVDDQDTRIHYSSPWVPEYSVQSANNNTVTYTTTPGSSFTFEFDGTRVVVYGTYLPLNGSKTPPTARYIVDGGSPIIITNPTVQQDIVTQPFWDSGVIQSHHHVLAIVIDDVNEDSPYVFDYLAFAPQDIATAPTAFASSTPASADIADFGSSNHAGAIVGGVIGGVAFLAVIALVFFVFRRRRGAKIGFNGSTTPGPRDILTSASEIVSSTPAPSYISPQNGPASKYYPTLAPRNSVLKVANPVADNIPYPLSKEEEAGEIPPEYQA
ncbi:hypothetical protein C8Q75DRAFT_731282 [Abortiporus biennis]|nr:hypothetical protein C8Q75DRAFT_731282 [Abortiporus biennis]